MKNHRLYNVILQNYPDILTRRHSEINLHVETPPADAVPEPAKLPLQVKIKKPKDATDSDVNKSSDKLKESDNEHKKTKDASKTTGNDTSQTPKAKEHSPKKDSLRPQPSWLVKQIATDHHYFKDMPLYRNTIMYRGTMMNIPRYRLKASSLPDIYRNSMWSIESESDDEMVSAGLHFPPQLC